MECDSKLSRVGFNIVLYECTRCYFCLKRRNVALYYNVYKRQRCVVKEEEVAEKEDDICDEKVKLNRIMYSR